MVNLSKISENLKELMAEHEISQKELAEKLNTGRTKLSDILGGKNAPSYNTFVALAEYFNCSADFLLGLDDYPHEDVAYAPVRPFCRSLRLLLEQSGTISEGHKTFMERNLRLAQRQNFALVL